MDTITSSSSDNELDRLRDLLLLPSEDFLIARGMREKAKSAWGDVQFKHEAEACRRIAFFCKPLTKQRPTIKAPPSISGFWGRAAKRKIGK